MLRYITIFFEELASLGWGYIFLWTLSSIFAIIAGTLIRSCYSQRKNRYFNLKHAIWLPVVMLLLALLFGGFLLFYPMIEVRVVMAVWLVISVVVAFFTSEANKM